MKQSYYISLTLLAFLAIGSCLFSTAPGAPPKISSSVVGAGLAQNDSAKPIPSQQNPTLQKEMHKDIQYKSYDLASSTVRVLWIPAQSRYETSSAISDSLDTVETFAQKHEAIAVLNGGFFDPQNQKTTSFIVRQGILVADPRLNERLTNNPNLAPYLDKILNRTEFRRYICGQTIRYDIVLHREPVPPDCQLVDAIGGGPALLPEMTLVQEGFFDESAQKVIRDPLGSSQPNARTAIGIADDGALVWVMAAQKPEAPTTSGLSLTALAEFMKTLGVNKAMNLDGGSSSSLYYKNATFYGKVDENGNPVKRPVKSFLILQESQKH